MKKVVKTEVQGNNGEFIFGVNTFEDNTRIPWCKYTDEAYDHVGTRMKWSKKHSKWVRIPK